MRAYNPLMGVLGGLNQQPVQRLKKTWARVSPKHVQLFAKLDEFFSVKSNYKNYRAALQKARSTPGMFALPYLGVILRDMVFIYEGANTVVEGDLSMQKLSLLSTVLRELRDFQRREMSPRPPVRLAASPAPSMSLLTASFRKWIPCRKRTSKVWSALVRKRCGVSLARSSPLALSCLTTATAAYLSSLPAA